MSRKSLMIGLLGVLYGLLAVIIYFEFFKPSKPNYIRDIKFEAKGNKLSVLLITVDALRADYVSANGYGRKITPAIDSLIGEGLNFTKTIVPVPRTTQSLACLLSGCYPDKTGVRWLWGRLSPKVVTMTEVLKNTGYQTAAFLATHVLIPQRGLSRGFDNYSFKSQPWDAAATTEAALAQLRAFKRGKPFFFWVHYIDPHMPYYPPEELSRELDPGYKGKYAAHFGESKTGTGEKAYPSDLGKERAVYKNDLDNATNRHIRSLYAAEVMYADRGIRKLIAETSARFGGKVVVILTADHGESLGEHDYYYEHGDYLYNAQLRVPLVFRIPQSHPLHTIGRVDDWVSLIDVFPTTLDLLGIKVSSDHLRQVDGVSLIPCWEGRKLAPRPLFSESDDSFYPELIKRRVRHDIPGRFRSVIFDGWKLIWTPFQQPGMLYELYDLESDPDETENLYEIERARAGVLESHLRQWMALQSQAVEETRPTQEDLEILKSLGYIK